MLETDHTLADLEARSQTVAARIADLEVEAKPQETDSSP